MICICRQLNLTPLIKSKDILTHDEETGSNVDSEDSNDGESMKSWLNTLT